MHCNDAIYKQVERSSVEILLLKRVVVGSGRKRAVCAVHTYLYSTVEILQTPSRFPYFQLHPFPTQKSTVPMLNHFCMVTNQI